MAFTLEHVQQVRNGFPRQVGELPDTVWKSLNWPCPWVYLGQSGLEHIAEVHPDVTDYDLLWLPLAIASGLIVHVEKNPKQVLVAYRTGEGPLYRGALKSAQSGTEIWVDSFYRIREKQMHQLPSRGRVLRDHK